MLFSKTKLLCRSEFHVSFDPVAIAVSLNLLKQNTIVFTVLKVVNLVLFIFTESFSSGIGNLVRYTSKSVESIFKRHAIMKLE